MRRLANSSLFLGFVSIAGAALLWQFAVSIFPIPSYLLPSPVEIATTMVSQFGLQGKHAVVTLREILIGFWLAVLIGVPIAVAITFVPLVEKLFYPVLVATQAVPKVAVAPLFEEIIIRGFLFTVLSDMRGPGTAVSVTAILFALLHLPQLWGSWAGIVLILVVGYVLSIVRHRSNSLIPSFIIHTSYNGMLFGVFALSTLVQKGSH